TLRRHIESFHEVAYNNWCKANDYESKLDSYKSAKTAAAAEALAGRSVPQQTSLDSHLVEKPEPYSDTLLHEAIIEWLALTDQPLSAASHPAFRRILDIAARAKNGVK
ncbi:hypothetical protein AURDEDRAFT_41842, partial [Auricularia subglabra TFB-10046 SS5]